MPFRDDGTFFTTVPPYSGGLAQKLRQIEAGLTELRAMFVANPGGNPIPVLSTVTFLGTDYRIGGMIVPVDAVAPTVNIGSIVSVDTDGTVTLRANISGGAYDTLAYAWEVVTGTGTITGTGAVVTYSAPSAAESTQVRVTVTAEGTGTIAIDGTSDTATDTEDFNVVVPVSINMTRYAAFLENRSAPPAVPTEAQWLAGNTSETGTIDSPGGGVGNQGRHCFAIPAHMDSLTAMSQVGGFFDSRAAFSPRLGEPDVLATIDGESYKAYVQTRGSGGVNFSTPWTLS